MPSCPTAVVLINQVTTKIGEGSSSFLAPALGETWAHACTNRVMLYWQDGQRFARLYKSPSLPHSTVPYLVTHDGVSALSAGSLAAARPCAHAFPHGVHHVARCLLFITDYQACAFCLARFEEPVRSDPASAVMLMGLRAALQLPMSD